MNVLQFFFILIILAALGLGVKVASILFQKYRQKLLDLLEN